MTKKKSDVEDSSLCAMGLTDPTERKVMATAMKQGEEQINIIRNSQIENEEDSD